MKTRIVIDTQIVLSAFFFGGDAQRIIETVVRGKLKAYATREIVEEYNAAFKRMKSRKKGNIPRELLLPFTSRLQIIEPKTEETVCSDPDNDKFVSCAIDAKAFCLIVNDARAYLSKGPSKAILIVTPDYFCQVLSLLVI